MSELKEYESRKYEIIFGSDVQRDGVYLELSDCTEETAEVIAEVFHYDEIGKVAFIVIKRKFNIAWSNTAFWACRCIWSLEKLQSRLTRGGSKRNRRTIRAAPITIGAWPV